MSGAKTVLLVEDSEVNPGIIRELAGWTEFDLVEAGNGAEGLRMALASPPDLVLLDLSMPAMYGREATRQLKADPITAHVPVVAPSAHAMAGDEARARAAGCDAFVSKPISTLDFQALSGKLLDA